MTTEDDFQSQLDADPANHWLRFVFAEWLSDHDDERAEGYAALSVRRLYAADAEYPTVNGGPRWLSKSQTCWFRQESAAEDRWCLPPDWFDALAFRSVSGPWSNFYPDARTAEDAAALAFRKLPEARRLELLSPQPQETT